jgi:hypothetical protein
MDNLKAAGIATVAASGNEAWSNAISWPACISTAVSVAAVDEIDSVASFSNVSEDLDLFAPGTDIDSSTPGGAFTTFSGTSMATPHVAGAWAVLKQTNPAATVDDNLTLLATTGRPVTDNRGSGNVTKPRIRLGGAVGIESPLPILASITPTSVRAGGPETTLTITGLGFVRSSVVLVDGVATPTAYVSDTELTVTLTANDLLTLATSLDISVLSPPPGGGTSTSISLIVVQPSLTVSSTGASPGETISVTLIDGPGNSYDWLALAGVGDPDTVYSQWTYVGAGITSFAWAVTMPATPGDYEFRLFRDGGFTRLATSPTVTVQALAPSIASISPTKVRAFGPGFTLTVTGADFVPASEIQINGVRRATSYVRSTELTATLSASDLATTAASIDITVFTPQPGGGLSNAMPLILTHPSLTASSSSVDPGDPITVTLNDGPGNNYDWLALASVDDPDSSYLQWIYVSPGATTATWTVTMPATPGDYEFRLFENGGFTRIATSPTVVVSL